LKEVIAQETSYGSDCSDDEASECDLAFATLDLTGVDFDANPAESSSNAISNTEAVALELEHRILTNETSSLEDLKDRAGVTSQRLFLLAEMVAGGRYVEALKSPSAEWFFMSDDNSDLRSSEKMNTVPDKFWSQIERKMSKISSISESVEAELLAIAALNIFLQLNYTGPAFDDKSILDGVNPHPCFADYFHVCPQEEEEKSRTITDRRHTKYHNAVLSELAVDGMWPCQVAEVPYLLLLARSILSHLVSADGRPELTVFTSKLFAATCWSARAMVAHERLLLTNEPSSKLWDQVVVAFERCIAEYRKKDAENSQLLAALYLEYGLASYHFEHGKKGKKLFGQALEASELSVEVTGSEGRRTKFQQKATAQMIVRATPRQSGKLKQQESLAKSSEVKSQMVEHPEDNILFETVQYENGEDNKVSELSVLEQAILLALCLDVKNNNPADGLTAEEMSAYLARVLHHHDDWIVYSTALLERAWLEFEGNHTKERALLQMQALADQHTNRLTITQSTRESIEGSAPVQDRLRYLNQLVYPPRWEFLRDMAERYASLGIVTSAAEIFTEIEMWDDVVECYRRAGKESKAEEIVRERLEIAETPRMWMALGDLTNDPSHYNKAIELSKGRFSQAYISLGKYYFDKGELSEAVTAYKKALELRPLIPSVWFRVGTISMQLGDWDAALSAFSEVVQQQPDEAEAWANVAAVHMHNKRPAEAYPALVESLKQNRSNWRVWVSKLYTCLDLDKYDEAIQACTMLLDLKRSHSASGVPDPEEKCIRAIVGGTIARYEKARVDGNTGALDSERRSLNRAHALLQRIKMTTNEPWIFETMAFFHERVGQDKEVFENLMKEYRALSSVRAWEKDDEQVRRVCQVVCQIVVYQRGSKEELVKSKFLVSSVLKKIQQARAVSENIPSEVANLQKLLEEVTAEIQNAG